MHYTPVTPFRRAVSAAHLEHQLEADTPLPPNGINKWEALRELAAARTAFGLSDRDLTVLQALVSFHSGAVLGASPDPGATAKTPTLVVHPSNKSICERLNGMPCSTMRRHLAHLVAAGLVLRRDSPNGKRYARRYGTEKIAFGFDLTPLVARYGEICAAAEQIRASEHAYKRLREAVSLMRRDLAGLAVYGAEIRPDLAIWDQFSDLARLTARDLRRKLPVEILEGMRMRLTGALDEARRVFDPSGSENMSINDASSEQHIQNSKEDSYDSELCSEKQKAAVVSLHRSTIPVNKDRDQDAEEKEDARRDLTPADESPPDVAEDRPRPSLPLNLVLTACPEVQTYSPDPIRHWHQLVSISETLRPMLGISPSAWQETKDAMGPEQAAVVLSAMLERITAIKSPGGYLRHLTRKAQTGEFSCGPMVMSLMRKTAA